METLADIHCGHFCEISRTPSNEGPRKLLKCTCNFPPMPPEPNPCFLPCSHVPPEKAIFMLFSSVCESESNQETPIPSAKYLAKETSQAAKAPAFAKFEGLNLGVESAQFSKRVLIVSSCRCFVSVQFAQPMVSRQKLRLGVPPVELAAPSRSSASAAMRRSAKVELRFGPISLC